MRASSVARALPALAALALATALPAQLRADGRPEDPSWFPIGVWLQSPHNAQRYREIGVGLYIGLYDGPTTAQLEALAAAGMPVVCHQNDVALAWRGPGIAGWLHQDEPDNAQGRRLSGYAPPIPPHEVVRAYESMQRADDRPVLLNLGQGAAWDGWHGRGERTNHPEDYPEYVKGCDVVSFDIYPVTHPHREVRGRLEFVGRGVERLRRCTRGQKPVWACIETAHVHDPDTRPTPAQVRAEVWIALACGADGIVYFAHEFAPRFVEAGLLAHDDVRDGVAALNREVRSFAAVLNGPKLADAVAVTGAPADAFAVRAHRHDGALWLLVASLSPDAQRLRVAVRGQRDGEVHDLDAGGDGAPLEAGPGDDGAFAVALAGYASRRFRVTR